ncbi:MAG: hypothetical protein ACOC22_00735 [bacterium]
MKAKDEKKEIDKMVEQASSTLEGNVPRPGETPEIEQEDAFKLNYDKLQKKCDKKARKLIKDATGLMMTDEMVKSNPYIKNKMEVDKISLSGMLYQMEVNKVMQKSLMEEVKKGASHPRMFEVFSQLSKTIGEINKQLLQTVEAIKNTYKDIRFDINERQYEEQKSIEQGNNLKRSKDGDLIAIGSKGIIQETKNMKKMRKNNADIQDVSISS